MLEANVFPWLGSRPLAEIDAPELLAVLKRIEARGAHETAHRVKARMGQVFRYAIAHGTATRDPSADLRGALAPVVSRSHAAVTDPAQVADQTGRASCRERVCQSVEISVVAVSLKK